MYICVLFLLLYFCYLKQLYLHIIIYKNMSIKKGLLELLWPSGMVTWLCTLQLYSLAMENLVLIATVTWGLLVKCLFYTTMQHSIQFLHNHIQSQFVQVHILNSITQLHFIAFHSVDSFLNFMFLGNLKFGRHIGSSPVSLQKCMPYICTYLSYKQSLKNDCAVKCPIQSCTVYIQIRMCKFIN